MNEMYYEILSLRWFVLCETAISENKFDSDEFVSLFKETYDVIKKYSIVHDIDRNIMDLVFNISGFISTRFVKISYEHTAATEIVAAMMHCCFHEEPHNEIITKGEWYIWSDIDIDFTKPEKMLFELATDFEKME